MSEWSHPSRMPPASSSRTGVTEDADLYFWSHEANVNEHQIFASDDGSEQTFLMGPESPCPTDGDISPAALSPYLYPKPLFDHPNGTDSQRVTTGNNSESEFEQAVQVESESVRGPNNVASPTSMYALIIGIDHYLNRPKLRGAVADAKAMRDYLVKVLRVPTSHICTVLDFQATRDTIIGHLRAFESDNRIRKGDPIVIFFAGHGGEIPAKAVPSAWGTDRKMQCIVPCDYGGRVHSIPDRTVGALIEKIANAKGDNITLIFDCCYSAGCVRDENEIRGVVLDPDIPIPEDLDDDIFQGRIGEVPDSLAYHGLRSHVLLAACKEDELAHEHDGRGRFTKAILKTLQGCLIENVTYVQLIGLIPLIPRQNPQCHGVNRDRILFDAKLPVGRKVRHVVRYTTGGKYVIGAGIAHGVSRGAIFTLHSDDGNELGVLKVDCDALLEDFETTVTIPAKGPRNAAYAKLDPAAKLPLFLSSNPENILRKFSTNDMSVRLVKDAREGKLQIVMENDKVVFKILDLRTNKFGLSKLPHKVTLDAIPRVVAAAAHFYWYLDLANNNLVSGKRRVVVEFFPLKQGYDEFGARYFFPCGQDFCRRDSDNADVIDFAVEKGTRYGIAITNNTQHELYLNAFLFNSSSLAIIPYYTQPSTGSPEAPLKPGPTGTFTIGYGKGKATPFTYWLGDDQDVDVGHLKIFLATKPIDMSDVAQASPFGNLNGQQGQTNEGDGSREGGPIYTDLFGTQQHGRGMTDTWFTVEVPIVQRRPPRE